MQRLVPLADWIGGISAALSLRWTMTSFAILVSASATRLREGRNPFGDKLSQKKTPKIRDSFRLPRASMIYATARFRNWRGMRIGRSFVKIRKTILYPIESLDERDRANIVTCRATERLIIAGEEAG